MANPVQRLRYFDGEYLRSYDFTDEQSYHIAMRRLMNRRLHLHGIVYGLEILPDQDSIPGGDTFYSIASGMAIDDLGREIVVPAPYSLTHVLTGPGLVRSKTYEVWLCYDEEQTALPAAGYLDCNAAGQYTRWQEGFTVQLIPMSGVSVVTRCNGVRLGSVTLGKSLSGLGLAITSVDPKGRHFVGIRAQRVVAPDEEKDTFDIAKQNIDPANRIPLPGYLDIEPSALERGNFIVEKNVVIGDDFPLDPATPPSPPPTGNLKITNDLFLQGGFFGYDPNSGKWYGLKQYIQSMMSTILSGAVFVDTTGQPVPSSFPSPFSLTVPQTVNLNSGVPAGINNPQILLSINEIDWIDPVNLRTHWATNALVKTLGIIATLQGPAFNAATNPPTLSFNVVITPGVAQGGKVLVPVTGVGVSYMLIFTP